MSRCFESGNDFQTQSKLPIYFLAYLLTIHLTQFLLMRSRI